MSPPGTPVAATSASSASWAKPRPSSSMPARSVSAIAHATVSAELDDRPEPMGTVDTTVRVPPGTVPPRSTMARITPATNRAQAGSTVAGSVLPSVMRSARPGTSTECTCSDRVP